ncbi:MAG: hypothetical protein AAF741_18850 [Bacteroidota bacterium]
MIVRAIALTGISWPIGLAGNYSAIAFVGKALLTDTAEMTQSKGLRWNKSSWRDYSGYHPHGDKLAYQPSWNYSAIAFVGLALLTDTAEMTQS